MEKIEKNKYCVAVYYDGTLVQKMVKSNTETNAVKKAVMSIKNYHHELVDGIIEMPDVYLEVQKLLKDKGFVVHSIQILQ